jgi:hypothetical protein
MEKDFYTLQSECSGIVEENRKKNEDFDLLFEKLHGKKRIYYPHKARDLDIAAEKVVRLLFKK